MSKPGRFDKALVNVWPREKCLEELIKHTLNGEIEWVALLLEETSYETLEQILNPSSWKNESIVNLRKVRKVANALLRSLPEEKLPGINRESIGSAFDIAVLKKASETRGRIKILPGKPVQN